MPDGGTVHTEAVTDATATEREASARAALHDHKASCREPGCTACILLAAAWRKAVRELNYAPLNHAPASGQITTTPAAG